MLQDREIKRFYKALVIGSLVNSIKSKVILQEIRIIEPKCRFPQWEKRQYLSFIR